MVRKDGSEALRPRPASWLASALAAQPRKPCPDVSRFRPAPRQSLLAHAVLRSGPLGIRPKLHVMPSPSRGTSRACTLSHLYSGQSNSQCPLYRTGIRPGTTQSARNRLEFCENAPRAACERGASMTARSERLEPCARAQAECAASCAGVRAGHMRAWHAGTKCAALARKVRRWREMRGAGAEGVVRRSALVGARWD